MSTFNVYYNLVKYNYHIFAKYTVIFICTVISAFWICLLVLQMHCGTLWICTLTSIFWICFLILQMHCETLLTSTFWISLLLLQIHNLHCGAPWIQLPEFLQHSGSNHLNSSCVGSVAHVLCRGDRYMSGRHSLVLDGLGHYPVAQLHACLMVVVPQQVSYNSMTMWAFFLLNCYSQITFLSQISRLNLLE